MISYAISPTIAATLLRQRLPLKNVATLDISSITTKIKLTESQEGWLAVMSMVITGDVEKARLHASDAVDSAERVRDRFSLGSALWASEMMCVVEGQWQKARDFNDNALVVLAMDPRGLATRVGLEYQVGDFNQGAAYLQRLMGAIT